MLARAREFGNNNYYCRRTKSAHFTENEQRYRSEAIGTRDTNGNTSNGPVRSVDMFAYFAPLSLSPLFILLCIVHEECLSM